MTDMFTFACSKAPDRWSGPSTLVEVAEMLANIAREGHECVHTIEPVEDFEPELHGEIGDGFSRGERDEAAAFYARWRDHQERYTSDDEPF